MEKLIKHHIRLTVKQNVMKLCLMKADIFMFTLLTVLIFAAMLLQEKRNHGAAVLIRAVEPLIGINKMIKNRFSRELKSEKEIYNLTSGPGKVCKAFGFNKEHSGLDLTNSAVFIVNQPKLKKNMIGVSKRIGITKSVSLPWRFFEIGNPYLSR